MNLKLTGSPVSRYLWDKKVVTSYLRNENNKFRLVSNKSFTSKMIIINRVQEALRNTHLEFPIHEITRNTNHAPSLPDLASNSITEFSGAPLPALGTG